jgi:hypothetical protein
MSLESQIEKCFNRAFMDLIDETINSKNPDFEWICLLYEEIKQRLLKYVKKDSVTFRNINDSFDIELFRQMIENDIFNQESMLKLINNTFYWIKYLQAPVRDSETENSKNIVLTCEPSKIVSVYIYQTHLCLNNLDDDFKNYVNSL